MSAAVMEAKNGNVTTVRQTPGRLAESISGPVGKARGDRMNDCLPPHADTH